MQDLIDVIATDHAPHTAKEKAHPWYFRAPSGLPLVQHARPARFERVRRGELDLYCKCGRSPFEGQTFPIRIGTTWVNDAVAYQNGGVGAQPLGRHLEFVGVAG